LKEHTSQTPKNKKDLAQTPEWFVHSLESLLGVYFELDVCADEDTAKAPQYYTPEMDGMARDWIDPSFCNPPFSAPVPWVNRAHRQATSGVRTAVLLPDNPETKYARLAHERADTLIRMPFRLNFERPDGTPFLDSRGKPQSPQFPIVVAWFTPLGLSAPSRQI